MNHGMLTGRADLHMHTTASDGQATVTELLDFIAQHRPQLDVIAITDHDTLSSSLWAYERRHLYPFDIVPGIEVSSRAGHILALWVTEPIPSDMDLADTAAAIREAGGISVLAHPFHIQMELVYRNARRYYSNPVVLCRSGIDAIETHNAAIVLPFTNTAAHHVARRIGIAATGGSDAHTLGAIGSGITRFPGRTASDLRHALENATTVAEGKSWPITDYIKVTQAMLQSRSKTSSELTALSSPTRS